MPVNPAQATKTITVTGAVTVTLSTSPSPPWTVRQTVTLKAVVKVNGTPMPNRTIQFAFGLPPNWYGVGQATTGSDGTASKDYTLPWKVGTFGVPCREVYFQARDVESNTYSNIVSGQVAVPTRISINAPDTVRAGESFDITGKLECESDDGVWTPLAGRHLTLYYNGNVIAPVTTASDGTYAVYKWNISTPGTYTLKAVYAGEGFTSSAFAITKLTVPEAVKPLITPLAAILVGGVVAIASTRKR